MIWLDLSRSKWHNLTVYCLTKLRDKLECLFQSIHKIKSLQKGTHQSCTRRFRTGKSTEPCSCSCESCRRRWSRLGLRLSSYMPLSGWLLCLAVESWGQLGKCCPENYVPTVINLSGGMVRWYRLTTLDHSIFAWFGLGLAYVSSKQLWPRCNQPSASQKRREYSYIAKKPNCTLLSNHHQQPLCKLALQPG